MKVYEAEIVEPRGKLSPGAIEVCRDSIVIDAADGRISLKEIQIQGKKRMAVADFLRGAKLVEPKLV